MPWSSLDRRTVAVLALVLTTPACATVPYTGRRQLAIVSAEQERELGATAYAAKLREGRVAKDQALQAVVEDVGRRLAAVADRPDWQWEFTVFDDPNEVNAWALPGGKVGVYTGILPIAADEAGLATILGHEVAHAIAHHGAERAGQDTLLGVLGTGVGVAAAVAGIDGRSAMDLFGLGADVGVLLPFSRSQEAEADEIGLILMARAGYDPRAAVALWERMARAASTTGGASGLAFLATHPSHGSRVAHLRAVLPRALAYYDGGDGGLRSLPGIAPEAGSAGAVAGAIDRLDRLATSRQGAEVVAFAIADEVGLAPDLILGTIADHELTAGEGALAFVLARATGRPVDAVIAAADAHWPDAARASHVDLVAVVAALDRVAAAADPHAPR
jgi:Zn-dependent protease with chaperone function